MPYKEIYLHPKWLHSCLKIYSIGEEFVFIWRSSTIFSRLHLPSSIP